MMIDQQQKNASVTSKTVEAGSSRLNLLPTTVTLAFWQVRLAWRLLLLEGIGAIAAVMLVCAIPSFYSQIVATTGFQTTLNNFLQQSSLVIEGNTSLVSPVIIQQSEQRIEQLVQQKLGAYGQGQTQFSMQSGGLNIAQPVTPQLKNVQIRLVGYDMSKSMTPHLHIVQGQLPHPNGNTLEIALTSQEASQLHVTVGATIDVAVNFVDTTSAQEVASDTVPLHVVGIFTPKAQDNFWHGETFGYSAYGPSVDDVLTSDGQILSVFGQISQQAQAKVSTAALVAPLNLYWYYPINTTQIVGTQTGTFLNGLHTVIGEVANQGNNPPTVQGVQVEGQTNQLDQYSSQLQVIQLPVTILTVQVLALLIFFVGLMAELLVERQTTAIALLYSRGASEEQIFGSMVVQSIGLGLIALIAGPLLALLLVIILGHQLLPPNEQDILALTPTQALAALLALRWYALPTAGVAVLSMVLATSRSVNANMLVLRREQARSRQQPLWQRLYLDVFAALIALVGYGISVYIVSSGLLNQQLQVLIAAPLSQIAPLFLLIACLLLFLRIFPLILRLGAWLAVRGRGVAGMLAMAQIARTPGQSLRLTLLLSLGVAFIIFCQVLASSQAQRVVDVANFQAGADFSGAIQNPLVVKQKKHEVITEYTVRSLAAQEAVYRHLPGVEGVSAGYTALLGTPDNGGQIALEAIDPNTFASVADWTAQNSSQPLPTLLHQLVIRRQEAFFQGEVPAIVDAALWNGLHLSMGAQFALVDGGENIDFVVVGKVQSIPTVFDGVGAGQSGNGIDDGGLLVDYEGYLVNYIANSANPNANSDGGQTQPSFNALWLKTSDNSAQLAALRAILKKGPLSLNPLYDRRAIIAQLQQHSSQRDLISIIALSSVVPLLLALVGNLLATWLSVRNRLTIFTILRALGSAPRQLAAILSIELGIVYTTALLLGIGFGLLLARLAVPTLVFTDIFDNSANTSGLFLVQNVPAVRVIVPQSLLTILGAFLVVCIVILTTMIVFVSRPKIGQALRVNED